MPHSSEDQSDLCESDLEEYGKECYEKLKNDHIECYEKVDHDNPAAGDINEKFVYPWMGIVANIPRRRKDGRYIGESGSKLRDELSNKGFYPSRVIPLWNYLGFSGFAIVEFQKDWSGFRNAMEFEKSFEAEHHGKMHYYDAYEKEDKLYGWTARADDYKSPAIFGEFLQKKGDLKSVADLQAEEKTKMSKLVDNLTNEIEVKTKCIKAFESKFIETQASFSKLMAEKDEIHRQYNENLRSMQKVTRTQLKNIISEHERITSYLEGQKKELEEREAELHKREALNEMERQNLDFQIEMNERATLEQQRANEKLLKLVEEHKREKENLHVKIIEMEKKLDAKQALELEIQRLRGAVEIKKHMKNDVDEGEEKLVAIQNELQEKEEELEHLDSTNQFLIAKERKTNDELQEARKELIQGLKEKTSRTLIGVKRMGDLDAAAFREAAKRKPLESEADVQAVELCSQWENQLKDPNWHPFKIVKVVGSEEHKEILDSDDEKLKLVKDQLGNKAYEAVSTALKEMNEYNPSGRYVVPELWNFKHNRKATLKEGVLYLLEQWKRLKGNKR